MQEKLSNINQEAIRKISEENERRRDQKQEELDQVMLSRKNLEAMTPEGKYNKMIKRKKLQADKYFIEDLFSQKNISLAPRILQKVDSLNPNIHTANGNLEVF